MRGDLLGSTQPVAYLTMGDPERRRVVAESLREHGWLVLEQPTGFHLVQALSGLIEGDRPWLRPGLIVIDAMSRGLAGTTIAAGLRDLGVATPVVLVTKPGEPVTRREDPTVDVVDADRVREHVTAIARTAKRLVHERRESA